MRCSHTSFFEQQRMSMGGWTGTTCKLFAQLKDNYVSFIQENTLTETAIDETFFFSATETDAELNPQHLGVKSKWKSQQPERFFGCPGALWGLKVEGQSETSYFKRSYPIALSTWSCNIVKNLLKITSVTLCHHWQRIGIRQLSGGSSSIQSGHLCDIRATYKIRVRAWIQISDVSRWLEFRRHVLL